MDLVTRESLEWVSLTNFANIDHCIRRACSKSVIISPINIKSWCWKAILTFITLIFCLAEVKNIKLHIYRTWLTSRKQVPEWYSNCCLHSQVFVSQTIAVLSTLPLRRKSPFLFHFSEKMGPLCFTNVFLSSPVNHPKM